jgi:hypothetical protein
MDLDKILSIGGKPGLYKLVTQTRSGFVAESLLDGKKISVGLQSNVSILSEIAIYTLEEEVPLREVFLKIQEKEKGKKTSVTHKDDKIKLEEYFFEILPDYDEDRVYASDIKKVIQWYNILLEKGMTDFSEKKDGKEEIQEKSSEKKTVAKKPKTEKTIVKKPSVPKTSGKKVTIKNQAAKKT